MSARLMILLGAALAVFVLDAETPAGLAVWLLQVMVVWAAASWIPKKIVSVGVICSLLVCAGFWFPEEKEFPVWISGANRVMACLAILSLVVASLRRQTAEIAKETTTAALKESERTVKVLTGLLPICAACKSIRTEAGSWEELEVYIRDHSDAHFTHSLCEKCVARLYPDLSSSSGG